MGRIEVSVVGAAEFVEAEEVVAELCELENLVVLGETIHSKGNIATAENWLVVGALMASSEEEQVTVFGVC